MQLHLQAPATSRPAEGCQGHVPVAAAALEGDITQENCLFLTQACSSGARHLWWTGPLGTPRSGESAQTRVQHRGVSAVLPADFSGENRISNRILKADSAPLGWTEQAAGLGLSELTFPRLASAHRPR